LAENTRAATRATASPKSTLTTMATRTFRLTYIDARRPYGVAGFDTPSSAPRRSRAVARFRGVHDPTEASRAIHGYNHEPHTDEHDRNYACVNNRFLLQRFTDRPRTERRRPLC